MSAQAAMQRRASKTQLVSSFNKSFISYHYLREFFTLTYVREITRVWMSQNPRGIEGSLAYPCEGEKFEKQRHFQNGGDHNLNVCRRTGDQ